MKKFNLQEVYEYVEKHISIFHQRRLDYVQNKVDLLKILKQKNPYLFRAKNVLTAQDLIKGFLDAFLQSQEETLFGDFIEGLAIFVCDKVYGAKKSELTGIDLEFEKDGVMYIVEIKAGWNWGNSSQIPHFFLLPYNQLAQLYLYTVFHSQKLVPKIVARTISNSPPLVRLIIFSKTTPVDCNDFLAGFRKY